jgi:hypothetical protein
VVARVLLAQDQPGRAFMLLERLYAAAAAQGRAGSVIEIRALQALALAADGQETSAVDTLTDALTLACPQGYVRVFADEGAPISALLGRLVAAKRAGQAAAHVPLGCLADLDAVLLTHAHTDHTGFAEHARATTGARVWVHEHDVPMARTGKVGPRDGSMRAYLLRGAFWRTVLVLGRRGATQMIHFCAIAIMSRRKR